MAAEVAKIIHLHIDARAVMVGDVHLPYVASEHSILNDFFDTRTLILVSFQGILVSYIFAKRSQRSLGIKSLTNCEKFLGVWTNTGTKSCALSLT